MKNIRLIARLDIKAPNLIKGIHLEGLRVIGDPQVFAEKYYLQGADELLYMDIVASLYNRNGLVDIIKHTASNVFIPMTVGGGIRSPEDVETLLNAGADKISLNTAAVKNPDLIRTLSQNFGSQCIVLGIEAKKLSDNYWEAYIDNGREKTGLNAIEWIKKAQDLGVGEILITSVDKEGTKKGFDIDLLKAVSSVATVPVIASGGMGSLGNFSEAVEIGGVDAVAIANVLHYNTYTISDIKNYALEKGINVRQ